MIVSYDPTTDMLSLLLTAPPYTASGAVETTDPDVVLHYDAHNRIAEIEIEHASRRVDTAFLTRSPEAIPDVAALRHGLGVSQYVFADALGISVRTLQQWEQGRRQPSGASARLLEVARTHPGVLRALLRKQSPRRSSQRAA